jgi:hypothetical protein
MTDFTPSDIGRRVAFKPCAASKPRYGTIHAIEEHGIRVMYDDLKCRRNYKGTLTHNSTLEFFHDQPKNHH